MTLTTKDLVPLAMIAAGFVLWASGLPDSLGFVGASRGLGIGAAVCAPLWLLSVFRRSRVRSDADRE